MDGHTDNLKCRWTQKYAEQGQRAKPVLLFLGTHVAGNYGGVIFGVVTVGGETHIQAFPQGFRSKTANSTYTRVRKMVPFEFACMQTGAEHPCPLS